MLRCSRVFVGMVHGTRCSAAHGPVPEVPDPISSATRKLCREKPRPHFTREADKAPLAGRGESAVRSRPWTGVK